MALCLLFLATCNIVAWVEGNSPNLVDPSGAISIGIEPDFILRIGAAIAGGAAAAAAAIAAAPLVVAIGGGIALGAFGYLLLQEWLNKECVPALENLVSKYPPCYMGKYGIDTCVDASTLQDTQADSDTQAKAQSENVTLDTYRTLIAEDAPSKGGKRFDLAFSAEPQLVPFALSFGSNPITVPYLFWPDWMTIDIGQSTTRQVFRQALDPILTMYFREIPDGKLKLNLSGLDSSEPKALTTWEVWKLSTFYSTKTEYYKFENSVPIELDSTEAAPIIAEILSTFSSSLYQ